MTTQSWMQLEWRMSAWIREWGAPWVLILSVFATGCTTVPGTGRSQLNFMEGSAVQLGLSEFEKLKKATPINNDPAINAMVTRVGQRIAAVAQSEMPNAQWEFVVFDSKEANAFCLPGGKVGVYTGILPITKTEAGLATVLGHEVAHAVAQHGAERMSRAVATQVVSAGLGIGLDAAGVDARNAQLSMQVYGLGSQLGVALPHSRLQESEADEMGIFYMARAGYPPRAAVEFWQRFGEYSRRQGGGTPWFLRTHPLDEKRVANLQRLLPKAEALYRPQ